MGRIEDGTIVTCRVCGREFPYQRRVFEKYCSVTCRRKARAEKQKARAVERYHRHKAEGRCVVCGKPAVKGKLRCADCNESVARRHSEWNFLRRGAAGRRGMCTNCAIRPAAPGRRWCRECLDKLKACRDAAKEAGMCVSCRRRPAMPGYTQCEQCNDIGRSRWHINREAGMCGRCGKVPPMRGYAMCKACNRIHYGYGLKYMEKNHGKERHD